MTYFRATVAAVALFLLSWAGVWTYQRGYDAAEAKHLEAVAALNAELDAVTEDAANAEAARLAAERERDAAMERLDAEAIADPLAGGAGLSPDSLRRLDTIR